MTDLVVVCQPCANGDHSSHDDHEGFGGWDMLDCKATSDDGQHQCMCRATSPKCLVDGCFENAVLEGTPCYEHREVPIVRKTVVQEKFNVIA